MLEYSKLILSKVSFDSLLFEKELKKSLHYLMPHEIEELIAHVKFHHSEYSDLLDTIRQMFFK
jgi:hypothetical protein